MLTTRGRDPSDHPASGKVRLGTLVAVPVLIGAAGLLVVATWPYYGEQASYIVAEDGRIENLYEWDAPEAPLFPVTSEGKEGFINQRGELVIPCRFDGVLPFSDGLAAVSLGGRDGYIDTRGALVIEPRFAQAGFFKESLAAVRYAFDEPWGYIDKTGQMVIPPRFDTAGLFHRGVAQVGFETTWSKVQGGFLDVGLSCWYRYIDRRGEYVARPEGYRVGRPPLPPGLQPAEGASGWGYVDAKGSFVIPATFEEAFPFADGLAVVKVKGFCGYIDSSGTFVIPPRFAYAYRFLQGLAMVPVKDNDGDILAGYIDRAGNYVWPPSR